MTRKNRGRTGFLARESAARKNGSRYVGSAFPIRRSPEAGLGHSILASVDMVESVWAVPEHPRPHGRGLILSVMKLRWMKLRWIKMRWIKMSKGDVVDVMVLQKPLLLPRYARTGLGILIFF